MIAKAGNPWGRIHSAHLNTFLTKTRSRQAQRISVRRLGVAGNNLRRMAAGDPSWLSQFVKHNAKIIGGVVGGAAGLLGLGPLGAIGGAAIGKALAGNNKPGGPRLSGNPSTAVPSMALQAYRPGSTAGIGKASGMTAALAPMPPMLSSSSSFDDSGSGIINTVEGWIDGSSSTDTGSAAPDQPQDGNGNPAPVVAIPSSGGGSMLYHHFFGKSNSKAIPVSQTNGMRPSGYHLNKHGYYLASIATWLPPGSVWVKGRRRNPLNPRALHRSISRLLSAKHAVKRLGILEVPRRRGSRKRFGARPAMRRLKAG